MRSEYGKLIYLLMDAVSPRIKDILEFSCYKEIKTVYSVLKSKDALDVLKDDLVPYAVQEIIDDGKKTRKEIDQMIRKKEKAQEILGKKYETLKISASEIKLCLRSIGDNNTFLAQCMLPIDKMIAYLKHYFHPDTVEDGYSLAISAGFNGARLSHNHGTHLEEMLIIL